MVKKETPILSLLRKDFRPHLKVVFFLIFIGLISGLAKSSTSALTKILISLWDNEPFTPPQFLSSSTQPVLIFINKILTQLHDFFLMGDSAIVRVPLLIGLFYVLANVTRFIVHSQTRLISEKISIGLRKKLLNQYLYAPLSYIEQFKSGSGGLISRMLNDINYITTGYAKVADLLKEPVVCVFSLFYLFYLNPKLALVLFAILPFAAFFISSIARSLKRNSRRNQENLEEISSTLKETLDGSRIIRSFNLENKTNQRFNTQIEFFYKFRKKITLLEESSGPIVETITTLLVTIILITVGVLISQGDMTTAEFMGFGVALALLFDSGKKTQDALIRIQQGLVARGRLESLLQDSDTTSASLKETHPMPKDWQQIEFKNISYSIGDRQILKNINLTIKKGETIALVGPSGSGKTSLLNLLERFITPDSGQILVDGLDITEIYLSDLRANISLVSQDVFLFRDTLEENIKASEVEATHEAVKSAAQAANVHSFIMSLPEAYKSLAGDRGQSLSGGEKQRISIARAFLKNAPILLLDEATSALDTESEFEVQKGLQSLMAGKTSLVVAHRLSTIRNANRIVVLKAGEIIQTGTHADLSSTPGEYSRLLTLS